MLIRSLLLLIASYIAIYCGKEVDKMLKTERERTGLSQQKLTDASGAHRRAIQELEKNMTNKDWCRNLAALSKALGCSMEDLLEPE